MLARLRVRPLLIALLALAAVSTSAQNRDATPAAARDIPRIAFEKYTLSNGLEVILSQNSRLPVVAVNLWYHVGPANEEPRRTGFAHLFEHMMFQGSKHAGDGHLQMLEAAGASNLNASTSFDYTNYYQTVPSNQLELVLWLESDRMGYLLENVDQRALSNQQDVVRNERRQRTENAPYGLAQEAVFQTLFPEGHPYYGVIIGSHEDIQAARLDDVRRFFRQYYAPNNATIVIAGDFDPAQVKGLVDKYFGSLRRGPAVPPAKAEAPSIAEERRRVVPSRVELPRVYLAWHTPPAYGPVDAAADIAANVLGGGRASRMYRSLVYEKQIAQDVSVFQYSLQLGSIFWIQATARPGHTAEELEKAIDEELAALRARPPDPSELEQARNRIETSQIGSLESISGLADRLNAYNHYLGTPEYVQQDVMRYRNVTAAAVHTFARDYLQPHTRVVVHAVPGQPDTLPDVPVTLSAVSEDDPEPVNADEPWRIQVPNPGPAKTVELPTPQTATLSNGLTLILEDRTGGVPIVAANLVFRTGSDANPLDRPGVASFVAAMLSEGTATRTALQIADELAELGASLTTSSSMDATTVSVRSLSKNVAATLDLMADVALRPSFPAEEIERQRASRLAQIVQQRDNPAQLAAQMASAALYGSRHPYGFAEIGTEASVKAIVRDDMVAFWKQNFVPNNAALVVAGDISMADLRKLAENAFGAWSGGEPARPSLSAPVTSAARVVLVDTPGAPQTQVRVASIGAPRSSPDFRPLQVMNQALGGMFSSRINLNLREGHGYTYGASSQFTFRRSAGPFQVTSGVRTDVTGPAVREIFTEIRRMVTEPLTDEELAKAKDAMAQSLPGAFETSANAVNNFSNVFVYNLGLDYYTRYAAQVNAVTREQTLDVAKRYLVPEDMVVIAVGDRATIEPQLKELNLGPVEIRDRLGRPVE
jgi:zinc protease